VLVFAPRHEALYALLREGVVGLLCLAYVVLLGLVLFVLPPAGEAGADFTSIAGVQAVFATPGGVTLGWVHYLAFDLFVGLWIARTSDEIRLSRIVQAPILVATLMFGPFGLLIFLVVKRL